VAALDYDVLVDTTPLSVTGRGEPTLGWLRAGARARPPRRHLQQGADCLGLRELAGKRGATASGCSSKPP